MTIDYYRRSCGDLSRAPSRERPTWLDLAHRRLDEAVFAAYGWPTPLTDEQLLAHLLELNHAQAKQ